jgi:putative transposase
MIEENRGSLSAVRACKLLEVSRSGYCKHRTHKPGKRELSSKALLILIKREFYNSRETYGCRRIYRQLRKNGHQCCLNTIAALMKQHGLAPKRKRRFKSTTDSKHKLPIKPNILNREFQPKKQNLAWVSDITYLETKEGWLYLAVFIDLYSRKVVGWSAWSTMTAELVLEAYEQGVKSTGSTPLLVHSDRGSQYAGHKFRKELAKTNCIQSMSRKGNCWDNAVAESFFGTLKSEMGHRNIFETREQAQVALFDYIEIFYNRRRLNSVLGYLSPEEFILKGKKAA